MKTKEQIIEWLDKQPWKDEFYRNFFLGKSIKSYDENFLRYAFTWDGNNARGAVWAARDEEYQKWYNSNSRPRSWEEYCKKNPVKETDCFITDNCQILPMSAKCTRIPDSGVNAMSKEYCEAFVAYMKLFQLRNAWVKNSDSNGFCYKIISWNDEVYYEESEFDCHGLSFPTARMAKEFMEAFKDLLDVAKPLL